MQRRTFLRRGFSAAVAAFGALAGWRHAAGAESPGPAVRTVAPGDADDLAALMQACVGSPQAFHGMCRPMEWTRSWAVAAIQRRPGSVVATEGGRLVGYMEVPAGHPKLSGNPDAAHFDKAFWCGAAGVRTDLLGEERARVVFYDVTHRALRDAHQKGFKRVRCAAPWPRHPYLPQPFADYEGLTVEPFLDESGEQRFLLEWDLEAAIRTLAELRGGRG